MKLRLPFRVRRLGCPRFTSPALSLQPTSPKPLRSITTPSMNAAAHLRDFEYLTRVERVSEYVPGGYHPIRLGDMLHNRYKVMHKLGHGSFSTVWLVRDALDAKYKALKLLVSNISSDSHESEILRRLRTGSASASSPFIPTLLDEFMISGPNGNHRGLVTEAAGCSVERSAGSLPSNQFTMEVARTIAAQLVLAVHFLHSRGVAHGDLHTGNILLRLSNLDGLTEKELYEHLGEPIKQTVRLHSRGHLGDGYPPYEVIAANVFVSCKKLIPDTSKIQLCDFGEAFFVDRKNRFESHAPTTLAPPETIFGASDEPLGLPSDIWTLACTIFEVFSHRSLFDPFEEDIVNCLGPETLPLSWGERWTDRDDYIDGNGVWCADGYDRIPLMKRIEGIREEAPDNFKDLERSMFVGMLEIMLKYRPGDRATADEVMNSQWMQVWGLPSLQKYQMHLP